MLAVSLLERQLAILFTTSQGAKVSQQTVVKMHSTFEEYRLIPMEKEFPLGFLWIHL
jgi:hypothetical protein